MLDQYIRIILKYCKMLASKIISFVLIVNSHFNIDSDGNFDIYTSCLKHLGQLQLIFTGISFRWSNLDYYIAPTPVFEHRDGNHS